MTTHELAKLLLTMDNTPIVSHHFAWGYRNIHVGNETATIHMDVNDDGFGGPHMECLNTCEYCGKGNSPVKAIVVG